MAYVVNKEVARTTPCKCFQLKTDELLCFSKGCIGALTDAQEKTLCTEKHIEPPTPGQKERIAKFTEAVHAAKERYDREGKPGITTWLRYVGEEAEKRGIEI